MKLQKPALVGIDISPESVRLAEFSWFKGSPKLEKADVENLSGGMVTENGIENPEEVAKVIKSLLKRSSIKTKNASCAIPDGIAIVKNLDFPSSMSKEEIASQIEFDGSQYIPYSIQAVNFDVQILGQNEQRKSYQRVLLVAAKKEEVEEYIATLEMAGLKASFLDVRRFSLYRNLFFSSQHKQSVGIFDLRLTDSNFHVFSENGDPIYSKQHNFSYAKLYGEIQRRYNLSPEDAVRMERFGGLPADYEENIFLPFLKEYADDLYHSIDFFHSSSPEIGIEKIFLVGGGAKMENLGKMLSDYAAIPVEFFNPFAKFTVADSLLKKFPISDQAAMISACGLALRRFS